MSIATVQERFLQAENFFESNGFDPSKIVGVGSCVLCLQKLSASNDAPHDLDFLLLDENDFGAIACRARMEHHALNGYEGDTAVLCPQAVDLPMDLTREWPVRYLSPEKIKADSIDLGLGIRLMNPNHVIASMLEFHRLKDMERLSHIDLHDFTL